MKIKTFRKGLNGIERPIEDRPIKAGMVYLARMTGSDTLKKVECIIDPISGTSFIDPGYPNFRVSTNYYVEVFEI